MSIVVPFNHQPDSVSIQTSTYTIPSGKYARVTVTDFTADFTIDSVVAIEKIRFTGSASNIVSGTKFTNTSPYTLMGTITATNGTQGVYSNANNNQYSPYTGGLMSFSPGSGIGSIPVVMKPNDTIDVTSPGTGTVWWDLHAANEPQTKEFWVSSGTDLDGSRYIVELYNELT